MISELCIDGDSMHPAATDLDPNTLSLSSLSLSPPSLSSPMPALGDGVSGAIAAIQHAMSVIEQYKLQSKLLRMTSRTAFSVGLYHVKRDGEESKEERSKGLLLISMALKALVAENSSEARDLLDKYTGIMVKVRGCVCVCVCGWLILILLFLALSFSFLRARCLVGCTASACRALGAALLASTSTISLTTTAQPPTLCFPPFSSWSSLSTPRPLPQP
jgi:hypothetical protein